MCHLLLALPLLALPLFWILPLPAALPAYGAVAGISAVIYWYAMQAMKQPIQNGAQGMIGEIGEVMETSDSDLRVRVHNEVWRAECPGVALHKGDYLEVIGVEQFTLRVQMLDLNARFFGDFPRRPATARSK